MSPAAARDFSGAARACGAGRLGDAVVLYARAPRPGAVKTRLLPLLGAAGAARLHRALLADALTLLKAAARATGAAPYLSLSAAWRPGSGREDRRIARAAAGCRRLAQRGADLGERMHGTFRTLFGRGHRRVVILGSDAPTLPQARITRALRLLRDADVVLGPARDGGYYLIGARRLVTPMFADIPWGTGRVLALTLARLRRAGAGVALLPPWHDIDRPEDLRRARRTLRAAPARARWTAAFLEGLPRRRRIGSGAGRTGRVSRPRSAPRARPSGAAAGARAGGRGAARG